MTDAFLIVRVGQERFGLPLHEVREVVDLVDLPEPKAVPKTSGALRGLLPLREHFVSLAHLGALIAGTAPPRQHGDIAAVVEVGQTRLALEVDDVLAVVDQGARYVGPAAGDWSRGTYQVQQDLVTVLDLGKVAERMATR